jgi:hypothetical protein
MVGRLVWLGGGGHGRATGARDVGSMARGGSGESDCVE